MRQHPVKVSNLLSPSGTPKSSYFWECLHPAWEAIPRISSPCLHTAGNGPGGIRTRTCDLDGVLCSLYTTGPQDGSVMLIS